MGRNDAPPWRGPGLCIKILHDTSGRARVGCQSTAVTESRHEMKAGRDPTRRNRNIGTSKHGHGRDNAMAIPKSWPDERVYYEFLKDPRFEQRELGSQTIMFIVDPPTRGCRHACTPDEVIAILKLLPAGHVRGIDNIVLRQPTRKQSLLRPCWGRLVYWADLGKHSGTTIYLEAQDPSQTIRWGHSLDPDDVAELERIRLDGHVIRSTKGHHVIESSIEAIRATQLFRTIPHEVGHYVHFSTTDWERYQKIPTQDREANAHRYADHRIDDLTRRNRIPFSRDEVPRCKSSLPADWFAPPTDAS